MPAFMNVFHKYLNYSNPLLETDDEAESGILESTKASICEVLELYVTKYEDVFSMLPTFVEVTWNLLTTVDLQFKYDIVS